MAPISMVSCFVESRPVVSKSNTTRPDEGVGLTSWLEARVGIAPTGAGLIGEAAYTAVTDSQGRFRIDNVKDGVYVARYRAPGYLYEGDLTAVRPFQVVAGGNV